MKVFSEESALQLSEMLLQNDKDIKTEIEGKIPSVEGLASEKYVDSAVKNVKPDLDGYATETFVNNAIANAQLGGGDTEIDLSGYATKDDLKGYAAKEHTHDEYLTEHQDISGKADTNHKHKMSDITDYEAIDLSGYALKSEIPTDYLSSIPDEYVTETEMTEAINNAKLDGESIDLSDYAKKTDIPDTSNFVEKEEGKGLFSGRYDDLTDKPSIPEAYDDTHLDNRIKAIEDDYVKQADIPTTLPASDVYDWAKAETKPAYTADEVGALPNTTIIPSIEGLATEEYVDNKIPTVKDGEDGFSPTATVTKEGSVSTLTVTDKNGTTSVKILDGADGLGGEDVNLSEYYTKTETDAVIDEKIAALDFDNSSNSSTVDISIGYRDEVIIPDKYNTGCKGDLVAMVDYFGSYYTEGSPLYITSIIQNKFGTTFENIDFTDTLNLNKANLQSMTFKNCRFSSQASYNVTTGTNFESNDIEVVFENCEFLNAKSAAVQPAPKIKMINCKIHDVGSDAGKVFDNGSYENCYIYNIGITDGSHADGIQVTGSNNNFSIINCRFDVPTYVGYTSNAALFFVLEGNSYNSTVKDCVMNGGGYTMYYGRKSPDAETPVVLENNTVENIVVGCNYHFGKLNDNSNTFERTEVKDANMLFVSSVYKDNGETKLLVTNYTNFERTLRVVTNNGETSYTISACPLYDEGLAYTSLSEFPFDIEYTLEEDVDYIVCYDGDEQIRFVDFAGNGVTNNTSSKFDNYYTKEEVDNLILTVKDESGSGEGATGYTPVKGVDYWTEEDKAEIKQYIDAELLGGES